MFAPDHDSRQVMVTVTVVLVIELTLHHVARLQLE